MHALFQGLHPQENRACLFKGVDKALVITLVGNNVLRQSLFKKKKYQVVIFFTKMLNKSNDLVSLYTKLEFIVFL